MGDLRLKLDQPVTNARLAHKIARITEQPLSKINHIMRDQPGEVLWEFRIWGRISEDKTEQVEQLVAELAAHDVKPIIEEWWPGDRWNPLSLQMLRNMIQMCEQIRRDTEEHIDLELGDGGEEVFQ